MLKIVLCLSKKLNVSLCLYEILVLFVIEFSNMVKLDWLYWKSIKLYQKINPSKIFQDTRDISVSTKIELKNKTVLFS